MVSVLPGQTPTRLAGGWWALSDRPADPSWGAPLLLARSCWDPCGQGNCRAI